MTEKQAYTTNEIRLKKFNEDNWCCQYPECDKKSVYMAHRICSSKVNIKLYGLKIIHDKRNLVSVCENPLHNDYFNCGFNNKKTLRLVSAIRQDRKFNNSQEVTDFLNE